LEGGGGKDLGSWVREVRQERSTYQLVEGGVTCQAFDMFTGSSPNNPLTLKTALQMVDAFYRSVEENKDKFVHPHDLCAIVETNRTCSLTIAQALNRTISGYLLDICNVYFIHNIG